VTEVPETLRASVDLSAAREFNMSDTVAIHDADDSTAAVAVKPSLWRTISEADLEGEMEEVVEYHWEDRNTRPMAGYLLKQDSSGLFPMLGFWRKRWFTLQEHRLLYFHNHEAAEHGRPPRGIISLANASYVGVYEGKPASCTVQISTPARTFFLQAESQDLMWMWLNRLQAARGLAEEKPDFLPFAPEVNNAQRHLSFLKQGFLDQRQKMGPMGWRWRTRWVVLNDGMLFISKNQYDQTGISIPLFRSQLREHQPDRYPNCFEVEAYNREAIVLGADNELEMHEWLNVILKQKLMIEESVHTILL